MTIMSNVSFGFGSADATNIIQAATLYGFALQTGFSVMVVLCCQLLGYGVAGLSARWLVEPVSWRAHSLDIGQATEANKSCGRLRSHRSN